MAGGIDDQRSEVVVEKPIVVFEGYIGEARQFADFVSRPGQEAPVPRVVLVMLAVGAQHRRSVKFGIERDRQEMPIRGSVGQRAEFSRSFLEVLRQPGTEIGDGATRKEEGNRERLSV